NKEVPMARFLHHPEELHVLHAPYTALLEEYYARRGPETVAGHPYPQTLDEWRTMRTTLRNRLIRSLGLDRELVDAPPDRRGDLRARVVGEVDRTRDGYRIERIEYQSRPQFYVTANLYLPASIPAGRLAAVFSPHGHWQTGKHTRALQIRCANLARRGFAVLLA